MLLFTQAHYRYERKTFFLKRWMVEDIDGYTYNRSMISDDLTEEEARKQLEESIVWDIDKKWQGEYRNLEITYDTVIIADSWSVKTAARELTGKQFKQYLKECGLNNIQINI